MPALLAAASPRCSRRTRRQFPPSSGRRSRTVGRLLSSPELTQRQGRTPSCSWTIRGFATLERHGSLGADALDEEAAEAGRQALRLGRDSTQVQLHDDARVVVETYFPSTTLVVVGEGQLAQALAAQGTLLGWSAAIENAWNAVDR